MLGSGFLFFCDIASVTVAVVGHLLYICFDSSKMMFPPNWKESCHLGSSAAFLCTQTAVGYREVYL